MDQFGGLMGYAPVMKINEFKADEFIAKRRQDPCTNPFPDKLIQDKLIQENKMPEDSAMPEPPSGVFLME